jgi:hypothetical protein
VPRWRYETALDTVYRDAGRGRLDEVLRTAIRTACNDVHKGQRTEPTPARYERSQWRIRCSDSADVRYGGGFSPGSGAPERLSSSGRTVAEVHGRTCRYSPTGELAWAVRRYGWLPSCCQADYLIGRGPGTPGP